MVILNHVTTRVQKKEWMVPKWGQTMISEYETANQFNDQTISFKKDERRKQEKNAEKKRHRSFLNSIQFEIESKVKKAWSQKKEKKKQETKTRIYKNQKIQEIQEKEGKISKASVNPLYKAKRRPYLID